MTKMFIFNENDKCTDLKFSMKSYKNKHKEKHNIEYYNNISVKYKKRKSLKLARR